MIRSLSNGFIKFLIYLTCRIDSTELKKIPLKGPYILAVNHINFLEGPVIYLFSKPRRTIAMAKAELWEKPVGAFLMNLWEVIPLKRGAADFSAMRKAFDVLKKEDFLCLAPEGTRSKNGKLLKGKGGVILFAQKANVPIIPVAHYGGESFFQNLKRLKKTSFIIKVGDPLEIKPEAMKITDHRERQAIADEIMISLAKLMPEEYHGYYSGKITDTYKYLQPLEKKD